MLHQKRYCPREVSLKKFQSYLLMFKWNVKKKYYWREVLLKIFKSNSLMFKWNVKKNIGDEKFG